jgi:hypothetical protein
MVNNLQCFNSDDFLQSSNLGSNPFTLEGNINNKELRNEFNNKHSTSEQRVQ